MSGEHQQSRAASLLTPGTKQALDYSQMSKDQLYDLHDALSAEVGSIEKPSFGQRMLRGVLNTAALLGGFAASMFVSEKAYLSKQRESLKPVEKSEPDAAPTSIALVRDYGEKAVEELKKQGKDVAWSCPGCSGCDGFMGGACFPISISSEENAGLKNPHAKVTDSQFANMRTDDKSNRYERGIVRYYSKHPEDNKINISGVRELLAEHKAQLKVNEEKPVDAQGIYNMQLAFASVTSTLAAVGATRLIDRLMDKPKSDRAHFLKHQLQHIEDELSFRTRIDKQRVVEQERQLERA